MRPGSDEVELLSAGHGPILHYVAATGEMVSSRADGVPLGIDKSLHAGQGRRITLAPGDLLVLVTDGFHEWERAE